VLGNRSLERALCAEPVQNIVASAPYFMIGPNWSAVKFSEDESKWNS
jgi:hypothetical protein